MIERRGAWLWMSMALRGACQMTSGQMPHPGDSNPALRMCSQLLTDLKRGVLVSFQRLSMSQLARDPQKLAGQKLRCADSMEEGCAGGRALPGPMQRCQMMTTMTPPLETRSGMTSWPQRQAASALYQLIPTFSHLLHQYHQGLLDFQVQDRPGSA